MATRPHGFAQNDPIATGRLSQAQFFGKLGAQAKAADLSAVQALGNGVADEYQQKRAWAWILFNVCRVSESTFDADPYKSAFMQGQREVGVILLRASRSVISDLANIEELIEQGARE